jgi:hypothetical protein
VCKRVRRAATRGIGSNEGERDEGPLRTGAGGRQTWWAARGAALTRGRRWGSSKDAEDVVGGVEVKAACRMPQ